MSSSGSFARGQLLARSSGAVSDLRPGCEGGVAGAGQAGLETLSMSGQALCSRSRGCGSGLELRWRGGGRESRR